MRRFTGFVLLGVVISATTLAVEFRFGPPEMAIGLCSPILDPIDVDGLRTCLDAGKQQYAKGNLEQAKYTFHLVVKCAKFAKPGPERDEVWRAAMKWLVAIRLGLAGRR